MHREYHKWYSPNLKREMELLVFGHAGARVLLFPTRAARFYDYENWKVIRSIEHFIKNGWLQVFSIDSIDQESFYCNWAQPHTRVHRHIDFENYVLCEVIPFTSRINENPFLMSVGCSMGAYHAVNIAFRHPHLFGKVVALSGRYDLTQNIGSYYDLLNGHFDEYVYYHMPLRYIENMPEGNVLEQIRKQEIILVCGESDDFIANNMEFSNKLWQKNIKHTFYQWNGKAHDARHWRQMLPMYL